MVDSKDQIVSLQADLKNKGRNFNRMLHKERIMAMFDLMFGADKKWNNFIDILEVYKSSTETPKKLSEEDIGKLQAMGWLYNSTEIQNAFKFINEIDTTAPNNRLNIISGLFSAMANTELTDYNKENENKNKSFKTGEAILLENLKSFINVNDEEYPSNFINNLNANPAASSKLYENLKSWYDSNTDQIAKAQEKRMHVRVNYFVREGLDVPEPLKQEFVDYIRALNPAANIEKVSDINWARVKIDKQITAPVVSVRQINNTAKPTTLVRATDIGVTQVQLRQVLNSKDNLIRLEGNPCNRKLNPFKDMNWTDGSGKKWTICGVLGKEDELVHFRKCSFKEDGTKDIDNNFALTKNDVAIKIEFFNEQTSIKDAIEQSFSKFAYFDNGVDLKNEAEFGQEIEMPQTTQSNIEIVTIPEPTAQEGDSGDNSGPQPEPGFMATNQLFLEDAKPDMVQVNTQSTISPIQPNSNHVTPQNGPSFLPGEPEENLLPIKASHTDPGDSAVPIKVGEPSIPAPKISPEMGSITMAGDALEQKPKESEQKPKESAHFSYNLILHDSEFRVLMMSRATTLTKGNGISAVSMTDRNAWIEKALNSSEFPEKDKTEIKEMKDKVDDLRSKLTKKVDNSDLQKSLVNAENKLSEAVQFFIFDQKLVGNTFIEYERSNMIDYKLCEPIAAIDKSNTVIYSGKNDQGKYTLPNTRKINSPSPADILTQSTAYREYEILKAFSNDVSEMYGKSLGKFRNPSNEQKAFYLADACIKTYQLYAEQNAFQDKNTAIERSIRANVARKGYDMVSQLNEKTAQHFAVPEDTVNTLKENLKKIDPHEQHALPSTRSTSPESRALTEKKVELTTKVNDPKKSPPTPTNKF